MSGTGHQGRKNHGGAQRPSAAYRQAASVRHRPVGGVPIPTVIAQGKTKTIEDVGDGTVLVISRDDMTAGDGARRDRLEGKKVSSTTTTCNVFELLRRKGVPTHYLERVDDCTFRARRVRMIPLELVVRRVATGSYVKRHPDVEDGTVFDDLVFEINEKDDDNHDPLLEFDFLNGRLLRFRADKPQADALMSEESLGDSRFSEITFARYQQLAQLARSVFEILEDAWRELDGTLFDFKIECGFDAETGRLLVADVIDSDSWRLRFRGRETSKENYRRGTKSLPEIRRDYDEVAAATEHFVN